jgi:hypothetical protein
MSWLESAMRVSMPVGSPGRGLTIATVVSAPAGATSVAVAERNVQALLEA